MCHLARFAGRASRHLVRARTVRVLLLTVLALALLPPSVVAPPPALAATVAWTGVGIGLCSPGANPWSRTGGPCWSNTTGPANGDDVQVNQSGPAELSTYDINRTFNSLTLNRPTAVSITHSTFDNAGGFLFGLQSGGFITDTNSEDADNLNMGVTLNGPATITLATGATGLNFGVNPITGTGPLTLVNNGTPDGLRFLVANTYTGATTVDGSSRVHFDVNGAVPTGSALTVNGSAVFQVSSAIGSLAGPGTVAMTGSNTLTVGGDNSSTTFAGAYQDSGGVAALTKTGTGTLTLAGMNAHTGLTDVQVGGLTVSGTVAGAVTVRNGATLTCSGTIDGLVIGEPGGTVIDNEAAHSLAVSRPGRAHPRTSRPLLGTGRRRSASARQPSTAAPRSRRTP